MIIVTGGMGFIGSNLVKRLIEEGERNILVVDTEIRDYLDDCNILYAHFDDFYVNIDKYCKNVTFVFHEGAISSTVENDYKNLYKYNINSTLNLIYYCRNNNIPLQYASSASVYGNLSKDEWLCSNKKLNPLNKYAKSKQQIDYVVDLIMKSKCSSKCLQGLRYFNVYGPNEEHKKDQASPHFKFQNQLNTTGKIKLFHNSEKYYRDFISVNEIIDYKMMLYRKDISGIFDIGTGNPYSFYDVAMKICKNYNVNSDECIEYIDMPENLREHYQVYSKANMEWYNDIR